MLDRWYGTIHLCCSPSCNETAKEQEKSFEKYEKQRQESNNCRFYKSHSLFYLPVVVYHYLFRNANTGKKTTQSGYCGEAELAAVVVVAARNALVKMSGPLVSHRYTPQTGLTPTLVPMLSNKSTKNVS